jgi:hypothetical protein
MGLLIIVLSVIYCIGGLIWFFQNLMEYQFEWVESKKRKAARNVLLTPVWGFYALFLLSNLLKKMWVDSGLGDDLKSFQRNSQKEEK